MLRKIICIVLAFILTWAMALAVAETEAPTTLVYGSGDYTRINPALDEHGEINILIFDGLTAHDADNAVVPALAERWEYNEDTYTYTIYLRQDVKWHDGESFTAEDVKFTIEAIMDPANESENASNYEDVKAIDVIDDYTVAFTLAEPNVAFLQYMSIGMLPAHLLEGQDMQTADYFGHLMHLSWSMWQCLSLSR